MKQKSDDLMDAILSEQAAVWFVRVIANDLSLPERREYLAWLKSSERHVEALLDIYRYHGYGRKAKLSNRTESEPGATIIQFAPRSGVAAVSRPLDRRSPFARIAAVIAGCAFSLLLLGAALKTMYFDQRMVTSPGQWDRTMLEDGSVLRIGPNTKVRWAFNDEQRRIILSRGEAVFEVAKDPRRPFVVSTDIGDVRAVGTEFGVSLVSSLAVVTVAHGKVAVNQPNSQPNNDRFLIANQQLTMSMDAAQLVKEVDATRELQWATGYYEFRGETVHQAIAEFNRRNSLQVVLADPAIGRIAMPFTTVRLDDPETFAVMLAARPDVQVAYENSEVIRLMPE